ncbi:hypothetical protein [Flagellimonas sp.]|uniref:hypothetical protein n=1 Tax=Flagellimonas sp. TaxID=2058762 RepID=UPI003B511DB2
MLKTIAFSFIALVLIFSILAPSFVSLLDKDYAMVIIADSGEEENNQEKESEKKIDEKDLFVTYVSTSNHFKEQGNKLEVVGYLFANSDFKEDIFLPPPENQSA